MKKDIKIKFEEAVCIMEKEGRETKARRPCWEEGNYIYVFNHIIKNKDGKNAYITAASVKADDWVIIRKRKECKFCKGTGYEKGNQCVDLKEKKTLSDKMFYTANFGKNYLLKEIKEKGGMVACKEDVKQSLKEIIDYIYFKLNRKVGVDIIEHDIRKIVGERLIK